MLTSSSHQIRQLYAAITFVPKVSCNVDLESSNFSLGVWHKNLGVKSYYMHTSVPTAGTNGWFQWIGITSLTQCHKKPEKLKWNRLQLHCTLVVTIFLLAGTSSTPTEEDGLFPPRLPWYGLLDHFHVTCDWVGFPTSDDITDDTDCGFPPDHDIGNSPAALLKPEETAGVPVFPASELTWDELETGALCDFRIFGNETLIEGIAEDFVPLSPTASEESRGEGWCREALAGVVSKDTAGDMGPWPF